MPVKTLKELKEELYSSSMNEQSRINFTSKLQAGCSVCLLEFKNDEVELRKTVCQHMFHKECFDNWYNK